MATRVVGKSWVTYLGPVVRTAIVGSVAVVYYAFLPEVSGYIAELVGAPDSAPARLVSLLPLGLFAAVMIGGLWSVALNWSVRVTIEPAGVEYRSGLLPWKREARRWRYHQIYDAMYVNRPQFWGWLLRSGDLIIVGREGSTREYRIRGLHNPRRAQALIARNSGGPA